jgi:hypothetical protein
VNAAPRIVSSRFGLVSHGPSGAGRYLMLEARFRVCDDSDGKLLALVSERKMQLGRTIAESSLRRVLPAVGESCRPYRVEWRVAARFLGTGTHTIDVRVRDAGGMWSNTVTKAYRTRA